MNSMRKVLYSTLFIILLGLSTGSAVAGIAVQGEVVFTVSGEPIKNGIVLIEDGRISAIHAETDFKIPEGTTIYRAKVVTPGLIDAHSVVGLSGIYNQRHDQDQLDKSDPIQPELRALDAFNPREELVEWVRHLGVTTLHTGHAPGALINGTTLLVKTSGGTVEESVIKPKAAMTFTLGASISENFKSPGTRAKGMAMVRQELVRARAYQRKLSAGEVTDRDLKLEALTLLLDRKIPALITADRATEIMSALRLAREFNLQIILDGASEAYLLIDEIKEAGVPVILHPTMTRTYGDNENASFETAALLQEAGILFAFQAGYESYVPKTRIVLYEAAIAVANGLSFDDGLAALTLNPARILGISKKVGSIEPGKDADLVLFDGDPFEYTTHIQNVFIDGKIYPGELQEN